MGPATPRSSRTITLRWGRNSPGILPGAYYGRVCARVCAQYVYRKQGLNPEDLPEEEQFVTVRKRFTRMTGASGNAGEEGGDDADMADSFGFGEGGFYTFHSFRRKAHDFRDKWFSGWHRCVPPRGQLVFACSPVSRPIRRRCLCLHAPAI